MAQITGSLTSSGDSTTLISVTGTQFITGWNLSIMGDSANITVTVKTGSTARYTVRCPATGVGGVAHAGAHEPLFQGAPGESLVINLSGAAANGVYYNLFYSIGG